MRLAYRKDSVWAFLPDLRIRIHSSRVVSNSRQSEIGSAFIRLVVVLSLIADLVSVADASGTSA